MRSATKRSKLSKKVASQTGLTRMRACCFDRHSQTARPTVRSGAYICDGCKQTLKSLGENRTAFDIASNCVSIRTSSLADIDDAVLETHASLVEAHILDYASPTPLALKDLITLVELVADKMRSMLNDTNEQRGSKTKRK